MGSCLVDVLLGGVIIAVTSPPRPQCLSIGFPESLFARIPVTHGIDRLPHIKAFLAEEAVRVDHQSAGEASVSILNQGFAVLIITQGFTKLTDFGDAAHPATVAGVAIDGFV